MTVSSKLDPLTHDELAALPLVVPLWPTAARAFGIGRTRAYELAARGDFPVPVIKVGALYRVTTASLRALLGVAA